MSLQQQCLPLPRRRKRRPSEEENEDDAPQQISDLSEMDASAYLAAVSAQASKLPFVFVAPQKEEQGETEQGHEETEAAWEGSASVVQYLFSDRLQLLPPPSSNHLPVLSESPSSPSSIEEYSQSVLDNFSKLRLYLHQCIVSCNSGDGIVAQGNRINSSNSNSAALQGEKVPVPPSKDSKNWHIFCLGKDEVCGNIGGYFDYDDDEDGGSDEDMDDDSDTNDTNSNQQKSNRIFKKRNVPSNGYEPTTSLLCQFDQIIIRRVLNHHVEFVSQISLSPTENKRWGEYTMSKARGKWIYALLSRLEKPLHRDEASSLSTLLRELCRLRSELRFDEQAAQDNSNGSNGIVFGDSSQKDVLATLNTLIIIVGIYFEQCSSLDSIMKVKS
mmetsp:Transcript_7333/g.11159  ORF Transcript_7333/g.11159 Transcript_7333/m.11159 type:complete len:386 (+) Transcript_7333:77-1234(+)